jgi:hypothetical protein
MELKCDKSLKAGCSARNVSIKCSSIALENNLKSLIQIITYTKHSVLGCISV